MPKTTIKRNTDYSDPNHEPRNDDKFEFMAKDNPNYETNFFPGRFEDGLVGGEELDMSE